MKSRKQKQFLKIFKLLVISFTVRGNKPTEDRIRLLYVFNTRWRKYAVKLECASTVCRTDFDIKNLHLSK